MQNPRSFLVGAFVLVLACGSGEASSPRAQIPAAPETIELPPLTYPLALLHKGIAHGEVNVWVKIGPDSRLVDSLVTSYTHKALADYTLDALQHATFQPLLVENRLVTTIVKLTIQFDSKGVIAIERHAADRIEALPGEMAYEPCDPDRLDQPLVPITVVHPAYSRELGRQGVKGSVVLEYFVDESGHVRMPVIHETEDPALAGLSLAAIERWQFNPPLSRSKPVLVHVRQKFQFVPESEG